MRIAIVGGGIAGTLLAWRLAERADRAVVDLFIGDLPGFADATGASGGLVRGFETDPESCRAAAESLAELAASATLRSWAGYREVGSVYLLPEGVDPTVQLGTVERLLPGSIALAAHRQLAAAYPFRDLTSETVGVVEERAGYISPAGLRDGVLKELSGGAVTIRPDRVVAVTSAPAIRLADGTLAGYDVVVLATGAWTPQLLAASAFGDGGLRTKQIQYTICDVELPGLGSFFHAASGLYGRPDAEGSFLLGLPCDRWDVDPAAVTAEVELVDRVVKCAGEVLGVTVGGRYRTVAAFDCYHESPGLRLRRVQPDAGLFTFTGGSGAAAKTALANSRTAAAALLR